MQDAPHQGKLPWFQVATDKQANQALKNPLPNLGIMVNDGAKMPTKNKNPARYAKTAPRNRSRAPPNTPPAPSFPPSPFIRPGSNPRL